MGLLPLPDFLSNSLANPLPGSAGAQNETHHHCSLVGSLLFLRSQAILIPFLSPGEILPKMPCATHSELGGGNPSLKPFTSVQSALSTIPRPNPFRPDPLHDLAAVAFARDKYLTPWDATKILPRAMTTSGGGNWHPSGKRDFTLREYATLQGFPPCHVFKGKSMKKQIGNAVPACIAKVLFESIRGDLDAADGVGESAEMIED